MINRAKELLNSFLKKEKGVLDSSDEKADNRKIKSQQSKKVVLIVFAGIALIFVVFELLSEKSKAEKVAEVETIKLELGEKSLDPEIMWRNHFEEKISNVEKTTDRSLEDSEQSLKDMQKIINEEVAKKIKSLEQQVNEATDKLNDARNKIQEQQELELLQKPTNEQSYDLDVGFQELGDEQFDTPRSIHDYIPAGSYITGYTISGIAASTALNAPNENSIPVVIKITDSGNLKKFNTDVKTCQIIGSSYGDLSSERVVVRAEQLICIDPKTDLVTTTHIVGNIHGSDGMNGIKGKVISTSKKHITNAMLGSLIGGLVGAAKGQDGLNITSLGAATKSKGFGDLLKDGGTSGASNAAERIASYYLKMAESMSPILVVPGGVKVNVIFMKGVYFGELGIRKKVEILRQETNISQVE